LDSPDLFSQLPKSIVNGDLCFIFNALGQYSSPGADATLPVARPIRAERHRCSRSCQAAGFQAYILPSLSLATTLKIRINAAIRRSRPGAERTASAISVVD
jgi:hypothetical protein